jgi:hypothetical protein
MCVPNKVAPKRTKMQLLKMILSKKVGSRFQMDLIKTPPYQEYCYILCVVDRLSKYGYVRPIKARSSVDVGNALLSIISTSITPPILQSDNGWVYTVFLITIFPFFIVSLTVYFCLTILFSFNHLIISFSFLVIVWI